MIQLTIFDILEKDDTANHGYGTFLGPKSAFVGYSSYIRSNDWRKKRKYAIHVAEHQCEKCGKINVPLQVHHKHYKTLYNERLEDVEVLCKPCHQSAHIKIKKEKEERAYDNAFSTWVSKKFGEDALDYMDAELLWEEFDEWLDWKEEEYF